MSRATDAIADQLHYLVFETIIHEINAYRHRVDPETGKPAPEPVPPALIAQALKALKDNGIDSPERAKRLEDALRGTLPSFDEVSEATGRAH